MRTPSTFSTSALSSTLTALLLVTLSGMIGCDTSDGNSQQTTDERAQESTGDSPESASDEGSESKQSSDETESDDDARAKSDQRPDLLKGSVQPGRITEVYGPWRDALQQATVDDDVAKKLADVSEGATVTVYLGTWCPDSRREVTRFWKALETAGGDVPFDVEYIGLDKSMTAGDTEMEHDDIEFVPTFVVERDGEEVGRVVENAPNSIEEDVHALLAGEAEGAMSATRDL